MEVKKQQIKKPQTNPRCNGNKRRDADRNAKLFFHHSNDHMVFNEPKVVTPRNEGNLSCSSTLTIL